MMEAPQNLVFLHWDFKYFLQSLSQPHAPPKRRSLDELWCVFQGLGHPFFGERRSTTIYLASLPLVRGTQLEFFCLKLFVQKCLQIAVNLATCSKLDSDFVTILDIFPPFSGTFSGFILFVPMMSGGLSSS